MSVRKVLVALDGKKHADYAFNWFLDNMYRPGDEIIIFHCSQFSLHVNLPGAMVNVDQVSKQVMKAKADGEKITGAANQVLKDKGIRGHVVMEHSTHVEEAMLSAMDREEVDQVVMGTRDLGAIKRTLIGSVSTSIVRHAKVPVTIVKMP